jgi:phosphoribosylformylglycinamidine (FGAM) synthase-like amidotransferase family enzyme
MQLQTGSARQTRARNAHGETRTGEAMAHGGFGICNGFQVLVES